MYFLWQNVNKPSLNGVSRNTLGVFLLNAIALVGSVVGYTPG